MSHDSSFHNCCSQKIVIVTNVIKIVHLNNGLSNKHPRRLFLSYIKCPGVNSSPAPNHAPATNRANTVYCVSRELDHLTSIGTTWKWFHNVSLRAILE